MRPVKDNELFNAVAQTNTSICFMQMVPSSVRPTEVDLDDLPSSVCKSLRIDMSAGKLEFRAATAWQTWAGHSVTFTDEPSSDWCTLFQYDPEHIGRLWDSDVGRKHSKAKKAQLAEFVGRLRAAVGDSFSVPEPATHDTQMFGTSRLLLAGIARQYHTNPRVSLSPCVCDVLPFSGRCVFAAATGRELSLFEFVDVVVFPLDKLLMDMRSKMPTVACRNLTTANLFLDNQSVLRLLGWEAAEDTTATPVDAIARINREHAKHFCNSVFRAMASQHETCLEHKGVKTLMSQETLDASAVQLSWFKPAGMDNNSKANVCFFNAAVQVK